MKAGQKLAPPAASDAPAAKPRNFFSRLIGVIFSPGETFAEIGRASHVFAPLLSLVLLGAAVHFVVANRYGYENIIRKETEMQIQVMSRMNVSGDRIDEVKKQTEEQLKPENLTKIKLRRMAVAGLMFPIIALLAAGVFKLFTLIMGASNTFKGVLSAVSFAYLAVGVVSQLIIIITVYIKKPEDIDMINPVASNLGAILTIAGAGLPKFLAALASWVDVFGIWRIALRAIGCAAVTTKMKVGVAAIPHVLLYGIAAVILSFIASFMG